MVRDWRGSLTVAVLLAIFGLAVYSFRDTLRAKWALNRAGLALVAAFKSPQPDQTGITDDLAKIGAVECRAHWLEGHARRRWGDAIGNQQAWLKALQCDPAYIPPMRVIAADQLELAQAAVSLHPDSAEGWFWLGDLHVKTAPQRAARYYWQGLQFRPLDEPAWKALGRALLELDNQQASELFEEFGLAELAESDRALRIEARFIFASIMAREAPGEAIELYRATLKLKPFDGIRWRELGDLLVDGDPGAALEAYLQSCTNGDPGNHGCYRAGRVAESMGDYQAALTYYRRSHWSGALQRADELELQLNATGTPPVLNK